LQDLNAPYKFAGPLVVVLLLSLLIHVGFHSLHRHIKCLVSKNFKNIKLSKFNF
jgi:hypothetical protein